MLVRSYVAILRRRWWILAAILILTLLLTLVTQRPWQSPPPGYALGMSLSVGIQPEQTPGQYTYDGYYTALSSEYLVDDFSEIVKGSEFAAEVSRRLANQGITVSPGAIQGSAQTGKLHRILQLTLYGSDPTQLNAIGDAVSPHYRTPDTCSCRDFWPTAARWPSSVAASRRFSAAACVNVLTCRCVWRWPWWQAFSLSSCLSTWTTACASVRTWRRWAFLLSARFRGADAAGTEPWRPRARLEKGPGPKHMLPMPLSSVLQ